MSDSRGHLKRESFYRLSDDADSVVKGGRRDLHLRPDKQKFKVTINTSASREDRDQDSEDEFAMSRIVVQKEVTQTSHHLV